MPVGAFAYVVSNTSNPGTFSFAGISVFQVDNDPGGITIADVDGDGKPDILATSINAKQVCCEIQAQAAILALKQKKLCWLELCNGYDRPECGWQNRYSGK